MRGTVAKRLRKMAAKINNNLPSQLIVENRGGTVFYRTGYRRAYKDLKKSYNKEV